METGQTVRYFHCRGKLPTLPGGNQPETDKPETSEPDAEENLSFAKQVVNLVNEERAKAGLSALVLDETLAAAMVRSTEIETSFSPYQTRRSFSTVLSDMGIQYRRSEEYRVGTAEPESSDGGLDEQQRDIVRIF